MTNKEKFIKALQEENDEVIREMADLISDREMGICDKHCPFTDKCTCDGLMPHCVLSDEEEMKIWLSLEATEGVQQ